MCMFVLSMQAHITQAAEYGSFRHMIRRRCMNNESTDKLNNFVWFIHKTSSFTFQDWYLF